MTELSDPTLLLQRMQGAVVNAYKAISILKKENEKLRKENSYLKNHLEKLDVHYIELSSQQPQSQSQSQSQSHSQSYSQSHSQSHSQSQPQQPSNFIPQLHDASLAKLRGRLSGFGKISTVLGKIPPTVDYKNFIVFADAFQQTVSLSFTQWILSSIRSGNLKKFQNIFSFDVFKRIFDRFQFELRIIVTALKGIYAISFFSKESNGSSLFREITSRLLSFLLDRLLRCRQNYIKKGPFLHTVLKKTIRPELQQTMNSSAHINSESFNPNKASNTNNGSETDQIYPSSDPVEQKLVKVDEDIFEDFIMENDSIEFLFTYVYLKLNVGLLFEEEKRNFLNVFIESTVATDHPAVAFAIFLFMNDQKGCFLQTDRLLRKFSNLRKLSHHRVYSLVKSSNQIYEHYIDIRERQWSSFWDLNLIPLNFNDGEDLNLDINETTTTTIWRKLSVFFQFYSSNDLMYKLLGINKDFPSSITNLLRLNNPFSGRIEADTISFVNFIRDSWWCCDSSFMDLTEKAVNDGEESFLRFQQSVWNSFYNESLKNPNNLLSKHFCNAQSQWDSGFENTFFDSFVKPYYCEKENSWRLVAGGLNVEGEPVPLMASMCTKRSALNDLLTSFLKSSGNISSPPSIQINNSYMFMSLSNLPPALLIQSAALLDYVCHFSEVLSGSQINPYIFKIIRLYKELLELINVALIEKLLELWSASLRSFVRFYTERITFENHFLFFDNLLLLVLNLISKFPSPWGFKGRGEFTYEMIVALVRLISKVRKHDYTGSKIIYNAKLVHLSLRTTIKYQFPCISLQTNQRSSYGKLLTRSIESNLILILLNNTQDLKAENKALIHEYWNTSLHSLFSPSVVVPCKMKFQPDEIDSSMLHIYLWQCICEICELELNQKRQKMKLSKIISSQTVRINPSRFPSILNFFHGMCRQYNLIDNIYMVIGAEYTFKSTCNMQLREQLISIIRTAPKNWDIIFIGGILPIWSQNFKESFYSHGKLKKINYILHGSSYIIKDTTAMKLQNILPVTAPVDIFLAQLLYYDELQVNT
jgi:hypothetical protein